MAGKERHGLDGDVEKCCENAKDQQPRTKEAAHMSDTNERSVASAGSLANAHSARQDAEAKVIADGIAEFMRIASEPDWISVGDYLPEEYKHVVAWRPGAASSFEAWLTTSGDWLCGDFEHAGAVTHWTPLPAPPTDAK